MRRLIIPALVILLLSGCSAFPMSPEQVVTEYWSLCKEGKTDEALSLVVEGRENEAQISLVNKDEKPQIRFLQQLLDVNLELTTKGFNRDGEVATVNVLISKPNFQEVLSKTYTTEKSLEEIIGDVSKITHEGKAVLHRVNGKWKIYAWELDILDERMTALRNSYFDGTLIKVEANPEKGFYWPYYLSVPSFYIPENHTFYLLVCPNNTGFSHDNYQYHLDGALVYVNNPICSQIYRNLPAPCLVPAFPRPHSVYIQALNRETMQINSGPMKRVDLQLIAMIQDAKEQLAEIGLEMEDKVLMHGFSASGWFTIRFTAIHPEMVRAAAIGGNNTQILPLEELRGEKLQYPVGVADLEKLTGKAFNYEEYTKVAQYIYLGEFDLVETTYYHGLFKQPHGEQIRRLIGKDTMKRWQKTQEIYKEAGFSAQFFTYEGIGHSVNNQILNDILEFFKSIDN